VPPPSVGLDSDPTKLFLLNSWFINGKNVVCLFYVMSGQLSKGKAIVSSYTGKQYTVFEVGLLQPELTSCTTLTPGQIGYVLSNMKLVKEARIGDTFHLLGKKVEAEPGFKAALPMLYAGLFPVSTEDFPAL
jgi:translation factor GUF1, mitochondrial